MNQKVLSLALIAILILTGCSLSAGGTPTAVVNAETVMTSAAQTAISSFTQAASLNTATPVPTDTATPEPPTSVPTATQKVDLVPVDVNCHYPAVIHLEPTSGSESLGYVLFNHTVQAVARNHIGTWLYIIWPDSPTGYAWALAQAFDVQTEIGRLPVALIIDHQVVFRPAVIWEVKGTQLPLPTLTNDPGSRPATVIMAVIVRTCPLKACLQIGSLDAGAQLTLTGRYNENQWAQFLFPSGPDGKGWVIREAIQPSAEAFGGLPWFDSFGNLITEEPPTNTPNPDFSPTPTETATNVPVGALAVITDTTTVYAQMNSLSPVLDSLNAKKRV